MKLTPITHDPFAAPARPAGQPKLTPVAGDPFAPVTVGSQFGTAGANIPYALGESVGGNLQALGEQNSLGDLAQGVRRYQGAEGFDKVFAAGEIAAAAPGAVVDAVRGLISPGLYQQERRARGAVGDLGASVADYWGEQRQPIPMPENPLDDPLHAATGFAAQAVEGVVPSLASGVAVGALTRNPGLGAAAIAPQVFGSEYAQERRDGGTPQEARALSGMKAAAEVIPEATVIGEITTYAGPLVMKALRAAGREAFQEFQTQWLQDAIDHPEWTPQQRVQSALYAAGLGALGGAAVGGVFPGGDGQQQPTAPPAAPGAQPAASSAMDAALRALGGEEAPPPGPPPADPMAMDERSLAERQATTAARRAAREAARNPVEELQAEEIDAAPPPAPQPRTEMEAALQALSDAVLEAQQRVGKPAEVEQLPMENIEAAPAPSDLPPKGGLQTNMLPVDEIQAAPPPTRPYQPPAAANAAPELPIFTGRADDSGEGWGASRGSLSDGTKQTLLVDSNGDYFWGDRMMASARDEGRVIEGRHKDFQPAKFASTKEARAAAERTTATEPGERDKSSGVVPQSARPTAPPNLNDGRILNETYRNGLGALANELEKGGGVSYIYNERGDIAGRSSSVNPPWFQTFAAQEKVSVAAAKETVQKALAGKKLGDKQARLIRHMLDTVEDREGMLGEEFLNRTSAEVEAEARRQDMTLEDDFYPPDFDAEERSITELAAAAAEIDEAATDAILDSQASDADVARQLQEVIDRGRESETSAGAPARNESQGNQAEAEEPGRTGETDVAQGAGAQDDPVATLQTRETEQGVAIYEGQDNYGDPSYTVEAKRGNYGVDPRQYELFPAAQKRAHDAARAAAERLSAGRGQATILGNRIAADFEERGHTSLIGQRVESAEDLAVLAQVYRDPRFETLRFFAVNADGKVVHQTGVTSRLPGAAYATTTSVKGNQDAWAEWSEIIDVGRAAGATKIYLLHNHPSGNSGPSHADRMLTGHIAGFMSLKYPDIEMAGHVIINHKEYSVIDGGSESTERRPLDVKVDYDIKRPSVPFPMLGASLAGPKDLAALSKMVEADESQAIIIGRAGGNAGVSLVATVPIESLSTMRAAVMLRRMALNSGSIELFAVIRRKDGLLGVPRAVVERTNWAVERNLLKDVIVTDEFGNTPRTVAEVNPRRGNYELGRRMSAFRVEDVREPYGDVQSYRSRYKAVAQRVVDSLDAVLSPLGSVRVDRDEMGRFKGVSLSELPGRQDYLKRRYEALGMVAKADEAASAISRGFVGADAETKQQVFEFLTTADAPPSMVKDANARRFAVAAKRKIGEISDQLVAAGLLSEESREAHRDAYLPRMYLRYLLTESDYRLLGAGKRPSSMGYLRQRKDISDDVRRVILGEVKDPGFLSAAAIARPARDMALLDWLGDIAKDGRWVAPNAVVEFRGHNVTPRWLKAEAEQLRSQARHYESAEDAAAARELANRMDDAADAALEQLPGDLLKDFRPIPDTPQYGRLRGLLVRREIYEDIVGMRDMMPTQPGWAEKLLGYGGIGTTMTQLFKMSKVALNPPGQVRNAVSNAVLLQLSGVPFHKVPSYVHRAWRDVVTDGRYWKIGKKYGVTESTFSSQELYRFKRDLLELQKNEGALKTWGKLHLAFAKVADTAGDVYQFMEALFKTAKIMHAMDEGMDEADAALEAQRWMFDYSLVGRNTKYLRNAPIGMPFLTFQLKVLPRLVEVATLHPQRLIPWVALFYGLQYGIAAALDVDSDDIEKLKKALPEWLQERGHVVMVPYKDDNGRWQFVDLGYFMPWSMYTEAGSQLARGDVGKAVQTVGAFGGPLPDIITAIKTGIDPFTDRPIIEPGDPPQRQLMSLLNYVWSMAAPPFITENGWLGKMRDAAQGALDANGDPAATGTQAMLRLAGLNTYAVEPGKSRAQNLRRMQYELRDVASRLRYEMKRTKDPERRASLREEYGAEMKRRRDEMQQYARDSNLPPKLR